MKNSIAIIFIFFVHASLAQTRCDGISIGQFFSKVKELKIVDQKAQKYENAKNFDFATFAPTDSAADVESPTIGYDSKGNICEIIFKDHDNEYSLIVYNFSDYRLMILKHLRAPGDFRYTPTAIYGSKNNGNFMMNVRMQFSTPYDNNTRFFHEFPIKSFNDISCIMKLDDHLYPEHMVKLSNSQIVMNSVFHYDPIESHSNLSFEMMHFYLDVEHYYQKELTLNEQSCMTEIFDKALELTTASNLIIEMRPKVFSKIKTPLWILGGTHDYFDE